MLAGRRYIVCRNREGDEEGRRSARAAILAALERQLRKGDKTLVGNKGYRRFLATPDDDHFVIDRAKAEEDAKFDGISSSFPTNARSLAARNHALLQTLCGMVERAFTNLEKPGSPRARFSTKLQTRPFADMCRDSFLALVLKKELEDRIATLGHASSWPNVLADLNFVDRDGGRTGRQTLSAARTATSRRRPRPARRRRRPAANRAATRRRLHPATTQPIEPKCSAKPLFRRGFYCPVNALQIRTVRRSSLRFRIGHPPAHTENQAHAKHSSS